MNAPDAAVGAYLPLRFVLTGSLAVRTSFDPLRVDSEHTIAGRAQRGMLAAALSAAGRTRDLQEWVARGRRVRFAPAYPRLEPETAPDGSRRRAAAAYPPPAYLYTPGKHGHTTVDVFGETDPDTPYRPVRDLITLDRSLRAEVRTTAERYLGRSRTGDPGRGLPHFTTGIDPGQVFEARWQLRAPDRAALTDLAERLVAALADAEGTLTLGSGGTRAHGDVSVAPVDPAHPLSPDRADPLGGPRSWAAGEPVDLLLLSPALVVGADGQARPQALTRAVLDLLGRLWPGTRARVLAEHVEAGLVGAYHRGYRGPMAQRWAARPGSVVRLCLDRDLTTDRVRELEAHTLGERAVDGHGQFTLLAPPPSGPAPLAPVMVPRAERAPGTVVLPDGRPVPAQAPLVPTGALRTLDDALLWNAAAQPVRAHARSLARASAAGLAPLTPGFLGRLREVLAAHPGQDCARALADLVATVAARPNAAPAARRPLPERALRVLDRAALVRPGHGDRVTVRAWLSGLADPAAWWTDHRPGADADPAYARALAAVDLSSADGRPVAGHPSGLSAHVLAWERRTADRLCVLLVSSWLAEAARVVRPEPGNTVEREPVR
ncbi:hypothetical protein DFP74_3431 [Nocardiopsis sp. Huas11]|uniref:hypothetical protein n=1 Tax=Nocardiopsis sp. Huas11 TaxID=2183912 RepID=UPI000F1C4F68|nr:hypothetical protein [Nocardiopsis sp. Huas11]RKS07747.1 hypothetical protein DFP74_3431 [Nocardiopsis sp. Huas11]